MHETGVVFPNYLRQLFQLVFQNGAMLLHVAASPGSASLLERPFLNHTKNTQMHTKNLGEAETGPLTLFFFCHKPELYLELSWPHGPPLPSPLCHH